MSRERQALQIWLDAERRLYADAKYAEGGENRQNLVESMRIEGLGGAWWVFISNYLSRARVLGPDTPAGRQAMGKAIVTMMHCLETAIEVHGPMPEPGLSSGEIRVIE